MSRKYRTDNRSPAFKALLSEAGFSDSEIATGVSLADLQARLNAARNHTGQHKLVATLPMKVQPRIDVKAASQD